MSNKKRINRDHAKKKNSPQIENEAIANHLEDLLIPAMAAQKSFYRQLNLRDRILTLPLMMAAILSLLWRNVAGVTELTRLLNRCLIYVIHITSYIDSVIKLIFMFFERISKFFRRRSKTHINRISCSAQQKKP